MRSDDEGKIFDMSSNKPSMAKEKKVKNMTFSSSWIGKIEVVTTPALEIAQKTAVNKTPQAAIINRPPPIGTPAFQEWSLCKSREAVVFSRVNPDVSVRWVSLTRYRKLMKGIRLKLVKIKEKRSRPRYRDILLNPNDFGYKDD